MYVLSETIRRSRSRVSMVERQQHTPTTDSYWARGAVVPPEEGEMAEALVGAGGGRRERPWGGKRPPHREEKERGRGGRGHMNKSGAGGFFSLFLEKSFVHAKMFELLA